MNHAIRIEPRVRMREQLLQYLAHLIKSLIKIIVNYTLASVGHAMYARTLIFPVTVRYGNKMAI